MCFIIIILPRILLQMKNKHYIKSKYNKLKTIKYFKVGTYILYNSAI